jgi:mannosyl-oligosaccharide alpha-1,2-mannosidase
MGSTIVDSLSTLWLLGLKNEFQDARDWVEGHLKFDSADVFTSFFEVNIRVLGGLLSAFELSQDPVFLKKAEELGKRMMKNLDKNGFPCPFFNFKTGQGMKRKELRFETRYGPIYGKGYFSLAEVGTFLMELSSLSYWTNNTSYIDSNHKLTRKLLKTFPKLKPNQIYEDFTFNPVYSVAGEGDSFYEYLLKQSIHMPKTFGYLKEEALEAINEILEKLVQQDVNGLYYFGKLKNEKFSPDMDHLACFFPGMLVLALQKFEVKNHDYLLTMAKELAYTCFNMYDKSASGLASETVFVEFGINFPWLSDNHYALRPETLESLWYLFNYTKDPIYQQWAYQIFKSIQKWTRNENGFAEIENVNKNPPKQRGCLPSYFFSETLKYLYLIFDEGIGLNDWVLNTEGHPFLIKHLM